MFLRVDLLSGPALEPFVPELARLRLAVFREWPYLYEGDLEYEQRYLGKFLRAPRGTLVLVRDGEWVVGASTALPLAEAEAEFQEPFVQAGQSPAQWYYFGESVLLGEYRGRGLGAEFFRLREGRARELGFGRATFCAVERPPDHPLRPQGHKGLEAFWARMGYAKRPGMVCFFPWRDLGESAETLKPMTFWTKTF